jgi:hypothetical protein
MTPFMKMKTTGRLIIPTLIAVALAAAVQFALGLTLTGIGPVIHFPDGYDTNRAEQVNAVLQLDKFKYLGGMDELDDWVGADVWTLVYGGDAQSLTAFLAALNEVKGISVRLTFSRDLSKETRSALPAGSWWVEYSQAKPDTVSVRINLAAESLGRDKFELILPKAKP